MEKAMVESFNRLILAIENGCNMYNFYILLNDLKKECHKLHSCKEIYIYSHISGIIINKISPEEGINQSIEELITGLYDSFMMDCETFSTKMVELERFLICKQGISADRMRRRQNILN